MDNTRYIPLDPIHNQHTFSANIEEGDLFFTDIYHYFFYKGFYNIIITEGFNLASMVFMLAIFILLFTATDYNVLFETYNVFNAIVKPRIGAISAIFITLYVCYWIYRAAALVKIARKMYRVREYYRTTLGISDHDIYTVKWGDIINTIKGFNDDITEHDIVNFIMRKHNFMIGLVNKNILNFIYKFPFIGRISLLTRLLEFNIKKIIYPIMYGDNTCEINKDLLYKARRPALIRELKATFARYAILNLLAAPFILVVLVLYFLFNYGQVFRASPKTVCSYQWSLYAVWKFREFNELPHSLHYRLKKSYTPAEKYLTRFPYFYSTSIAKFISFMAGTFITILTIFTMIDDQFLFHGVVFGDYSIVFVLGVLGTIFTISQFFNIPDNIVNEPEENMKEVVDWTHYFPEAWRNNVHHYTIRNEFNALFEFKLTFIMNEILSVITTPFILWFVLRPKSEQIIDFLQDFIVKTPRVGYICSFANFDLTKHGSNQYGNESTEYMQTNNGKMEKSMISFQKEYPEWKPPANGKSWMQQTQMPGESIFLLEQKFGASTLNGGV